jgi:hypothetical protein
MKSICMSARIHSAVAIGAALASMQAIAPTLRGQAKAELDAVQADVSIAEIQTTLDAINIDRTSGRPGERQAAEYLGRKLTEYGVKHAVYDPRLYMSWPGLAEVTVDGAPPLTIRGVTPAFGASTPAGGLAAEAIDRRDNQPLGPEVKGKIAFFPAACRPIDRSPHSARAWPVSFRSSRARSPMK